MSAVKREIQWALSARGQITALARFAAIGQRDSGRNHPRGAYGQGGEAVPMRRLSIIVRGPTQDNGVSTCQTGRVRACVEAGAIRDEIGRPISIADRPGNAIIVVRIDLEV